MDPLWLVLAGGGSAGAACPATRGREFLWRYGGVLEWIVAGGSTWPRHGLGRARHDALEHTLASGVRFSRDSGRAAAPTGLRRQRGAVLPGSNLNDGRD